MSTVPAPHPMTRSPARLWSGLLAAFLALHGIAHFVGTTSSLRLAADGKAAEYLGGAWVITEPAVLRALAVLWAAAGVAFVAVALLAWLRPARLRSPLLWVAAASLVLSVAALWAAVVGVVIDLALLALVWAAPPAAFGGDRP